MELQDFVADFESFLTSTEPARTASERDDDYINHKQWKQDEEDKLKARGQAPVVINKVKTKVNFLTGLQRQRRTDPKALPRTPKHEKEAGSVTEALRYVADNVDFPMLSSETFQREIGWGYGAAIVDVDPSTKDVTVTDIASDRFYYDPFSRRLDFKDGRFMGVVLWMDEQDAIDTFPDKEEDIRSLIGSDNLDGTSFEDKPAFWVDRVRKRLRVCQHYFRDAEGWKVTYFTGTAFMMEPKPSPFLDENGARECPIEAQTAYIDRENNRYGEVRSYIWAQDEINHRRSKALYNLSTRQTMGDKGVVDVNVMKGEMAKANGHVELQGGPDMRFEVLNNTDQTEGQLLLYQDAKADIDAVGANAAMQGKMDGQPVSGRAVQALQQGGIAELGGLFDQHKHWERRCYRQMWNRIRQFWTDERWIRVTDNEDNLKWVHLNQPVTAGQQLKERAEQGDQMAQQVLQQALAEQDPRLNQVVQVRNNVAELDVDIILTESPDYVTIRQEQFETLAQLATAYGPEAVPFEVMLKLSDLPNKEEVEQLLKPDDVDPVREQAKAQLQQEVVMMQVEDAEEELTAKKLDNEKRIEDILQKRVETDQLAMTPPSSVQVSV